MNNKEKAERLAAEGMRKFGHKAAYVGNTRYKLDVLPSGILAVDYATGIGGYARGHCTEVFGPPTFGKTSIIGYNAIKSAQAHGMFCGIIAVEPRFSAPWAEKNGVNTEELVVMYPDDGAQAFDMMKSWVWDPERPFDFILFDSIGGVTSEEDMKDGAGSRVGGQAKLITDGIKRIVMGAWKNEVTCLFINQIRDDMNARYAGAVKSPGGHALEHAMMYRIQLSPGSNRYFKKIDGDDTLVGRELIAKMVKANGAEAEGNKARFDFYHRETEEYGFGLDVTSDVINTGSKLGIIKVNGSYYQHPSFPKQKNGKNQLQGKEKVAAFMAENPDFVQTIRQEILEVLLVQQQEAVITKPQLEVVE